ncbi:capsular polysaccharide export protein, LipB/KpsS family [Sinorhizobium fredii]|uniref:capsular polysaccharide export protein, LipB/KpsS family n=1 Tax=Rhizobium fredii TaxID=380 RepID=UPI002109C5A0|nr:capsular polysaccharide biosynthesis protein [Sinorhizobium fredii]UTY46685.1 capsular polysaccharide biosynthesis protein [Sinorhizobium fredii]
MSHIEGGCTRRSALFVGFAPWRHALPRWFPEYHCTVTSRNPIALVLSGWLLRLPFLRPVVHVWGFKYPLLLKTYCRLFAIPFCHVEDGFVRSVALGADGAMPAALVVDFRTPYFDARSASDLETLLSTYEFTKDPALIVRARRAMDMLLEYRVSKYNLGAERRAEEVYGPKTKRRVLVIGQVEGDASIRYGCALPRSNNDLVRLAVRENPDAEVIYKPHPDVLYGKRPARSSPTEVAHLCRVLTEDISPSTALNTIDHVYTMTSLMGFEALMVGKKVTCCGMPFYAGWGLTDDRQANSRRKRRLSLAEVFAGAYLLYARYFDPQSGTPNDLETVIARLAETRDR